MPGDRTIDVRIFNTNTSRVIVDTVEVDENGSFNEDGDYAIPGVKGTGSEVKVAFVDPAGSMTGTLFPTGRRSDTIRVQEKDGPSFHVSATLIDATNPFVLVDKTTLPAFLKVEPGKDTSEYLKHMESIRRAGAVMMGLAPTIEAAAKVRATPKLAILSSPSSRIRTNSIEDAGRTPDIHVQAFSMGKPHPSLQLTGAACIASAVCIKGTIVHALVSGSTKRIEFPEDQESPWNSPERTPSPSNSDSLSSSGPSLVPSPRTVRLSHSAGSIDVEVLATCSEGFAFVDRCVVSRTARRLFEGKVYYYEDRTSSDF
ncbi:hypothetical protein CFE70_007562 [Pyrenophora teres f. teres 0-1]|uniref:Uncharacterized protein n=2 Tax=Pyrenophora teres f. teres TaxID=97479 RepID=E3S431_PYRTT|nr:hypothetical protein PTT_17285 [Pyrenophora teres f. teres 0-1]